MQPSASAQTSAPIKKPEYFAIPIARLVGLSVLTFSLYDLYWLYKNWSAVKAADNSDIQPFWRAFFGLFFFHSFLKRFAHDSEANGLKVAYSAGLLATIWIILMLLSNALGRMSLSGAEPNIILLAISFLTFAPMIPVQNAINAYSKTVLNQPEKKDFETGEIVLMVIGGIVWALSIIGAARM